MILIMGLAGSGKGTQGKLLAENLGYRYLSTGDFLREYITEQRRQEMAAGKLINDEEMISIIQSFLSQASSKNDCILDGFPRSQAQADWLISQHQAGELKIEAVVYLKVPTEELVKRLLNRARPDDTEAAIKKRFEEYSKSTSPIIDDYSARGIKIIEVDGNRPVEIIHNNILDLLKTN